MAEHIQKGQRHPEVKRNLSGLRGLIQDSLAIKADQPGKVREGVVVQGLDEGRKIGLGLGISLQGQDPHSPIIGAKNNRLTVGLESGRGSQHHRTQ